MKIKKLLSLTLSLALLLPIIKVSNFITYADPAPTSPNFTASASDWAKKEIEQCHKLLGVKTSNLKILKGDFKEAATREEFAELAYVMYLELSSVYNRELPIVKKNHFTDCNNMFIVKAYNYGIIEGVSNSKFAPNASLTREQLATMLYRTTNKIIQDGYIAVADFKFKKDYKDINQISDWAYDAVRYLNNEDIMQGDGINLKPKDKVTREEALSLINRHYDNLASRYSLIKPEEEAIYRDTIAGAVYDKIGYKRGDDPLFFKEINDFNRDGTLDCILVCKDKTSGIGDKIALLEFNDDGTDCKIKYSIDCTAKSTEYVDLRFVEGKTSKELYIKGESSEDSVGFSLYNISDGRITEDLNLSPIFGEGISELIDTDYDGVYDYFTYKKKNFEVLYYPVSIECTLTNEGYVAYKSGDAQIPEYPSNPEAVVEEYLELNYLKHHLNSIITDRNYTLKKLDKRLKELYKNGFDKDYLIDGEILKYHILDNGYDLMEYKTEIKGNKAKTTLEFNAIKYDFDLVKVNDKWTIERIKK